MQSSRVVTSGIILAIVGVVLFSAKAVMVKLAYRYHASVEHLLLFRMLFSLPFYIAIAFIKKPSKSLKVNPSDYLWLLFFGFIGYYLASYFDFLGLRFIKAGLERIILFIYPTLVLIISRIFLKKYITNQQIFAIIITYFGVVVSFWGELDFKTSNLAIGGFLIFLSALTYAMYIVGSGWLIPKFGTVRFTSYAMIIASLCIIVQYLIWDRGNIVAYPIEVYILALLMAVFSTIIPSFMVSSAIEKLGASNFSIVASIGPISTIILAYFFLDESLSLLQVFGGLVVIFGIYYSRKK